MEFIEKLKEAFVSVIPVVIIVILLSIFLIPMDSETMTRFIIGTVFTIFGLGVFLRGADIGILPMGEQIGSAITKKKNLLIIVIIGFIIGVIITIAEPDVQVLAEQVFNASNEEIAKNVLVISVAIGVGIFVSLSLVRIIIQFSLRKALIIGYIIAFAIASFTSPDFLAMAFDSGGVTTGALTVPFLLALGTGVSSMRADKSAEADCFGIVGLASIGPIIALLVLGVIY